MPVYTLFSQVGGDVIAADTSSYTMGVQFVVTLTGGDTAALTGIWWNSPTSAQSLPGTIGLYQVTGVGTGTLIHSEAASWSAGIGTGWVRAAFSSAPSLTSGTSYKAVILDNAGDNFYGATHSYWTTGPGGSGITNGPLFAPNSANADGGQDTFNVGASLTYPASSFSDSNYWVDPEVTVTTSGVNAGLATGAGAALGPTP